MTGSLDRDRLGRLLDALNDRLRRANVRASLYLVGGAAMLLAYGRTRATSDVDVRIDAANEAVTAAVAEHGLEYDWLNQHAAACIPREADRRAPTLYNTPNLVITGASAEHLLAMKLDPRRARPWAHPPPRGSARPGCRARRSGSTQCERGRRPVRRTPTPCLSALSAAEPSRRCWPAWPSRPSSHQAGFPIPRRTRAGAVSRAAPSSRPKRSRRRGGARLEACGQQVRVRPERLGPVMARTCRSPPAVRCGRGPGLDEHRELAVGRRRRQSVPADGADTPAMKSSFAITGLLFIGDAAERGEFGQVRGEGGVLEPAAGEPGVEVAERAGADAPTTPRGPPARAPPAGRSR